MARLTDDERAFFGASDSLTYDRNGHTVLRGLTYEETQAYLDHWRRISSSSTARTQCATISWRCIGGTWMPWRS